MKEGILSSEIKVVKRKVRAGNTSLVNKIPENFIISDNKRVVSLTKWVFDADIKGCFNNIDHD
jgi:hypothetical protein